MKIRVTWNAGQQLFIAFLLAFATSAQAKDISKSTIASVSPQAHSSLTAETVLRHNKHLLNQTTIGSDLKASNKQGVRNLYKKAYGIFLDATDAYKSGLEKMAKELAHKSISLFYAADKAHYNLAGRF